MKKVVRFIIKFVNKATADSVPAYAAQVAFFVMLSFFPFMMLLVMIVSKLSVMNTNVLGYILRVVPSGLESYVAYIVDDVVNANVQSFTLITVFVSLWSAAKGIQALSTGLNKIYGVEQNKNYFLVRLICALYTLVFMVLCIVVIAIQAFGSQIAHKIIDNYPAFADATLLILSLKNVVTFLVIFVFLLLIYYQLPNRRGHMRHEFTGAVLASLAWMLMTRGFSVYIKYSADNSKMYGSMTSVVLIIIWLYIGMQIVLYGAEINYYLSDLIWKYREKYHMKKKAKREEKQKIKKNQKEKAGLDLNVIDHYNGTERSVKTLSGGESFQASLSLALGLSDEIQASAGGIRLDSMFVDEGFGSLDEESLEQALKALAGLADGKRLVGIISHVSELKERIDNKIIVTKQCNGENMGSSIRIQ